MATAKFFPIIAEKKMIIFPRDIIFHILMDSYETIWTVSPHDSDPKNGIVSAKSPLGGSLLEAREIYHCPDGVFDYKILSVQIDGQEYKYAGRAWFRKLVEQLAKVSTESTPQKPAISEHISLKVSPFRKLLRQLISVGAQVGFRTPDIDEHDLRLALKWSSLNQHTNLSRKPELPDRASFLENKDSERELSRVLSARAAEKVALSFYREYESQVADISITQVLPGEKGDYHSYDIRVGEYCVDVKNARRPSGGSDTYVDHCIPEFKCSRENKSVRIAGVLSPFIPARALLGLIPGTQTQVVFLGETSNEAVTSLEKEFHHPHSFEIDFFRSSSGTVMFFPPWIFDYPLTIYKQRDEVLTAISQPASPEYQLCKEEKSNALPLWLAAGVDPESENLGLHLFQWQHDLVGKILQWRNPYGLSLPFLFLTILSHFCEMALHPATKVQGYHPRYYKELFYVQSGNSAYDQHPLFIFDPLKTIKTLIDVLCIIWDRNPDAIRGFRRFQLKSQGILRGQSGSQGIWKTLLAYCGGKLPDNKPCRKAPLVLGECKPCPDCGRLVCPDCGYCSPNCDAHKKTRS